MKGVHCLVSIKNYIISNNLHILIFFILCILSYLFLLIIYLFKKNNKNILSIVDDKFTYRSILILSISFGIVFSTVFFYSSAFFPKFLSSYLFFGLINYFAVMATKTKDTYFNTKLEPLFDLFPECRDINLLLDSYIKKNSLNYSSNFDDLNEQLMNFKNPMIELLLNEIDSFKANQNVIKFSIIFLFLGIFTGMFFDPSLIYNFDGNNISLLLATTGLVIVAILYISYFILSNLDDNDKSMKKINLLRFYLINFITHKKVYEKNEFNIDRKNKIRETYKIQFIKKKYRG